MGSDHSSNVDMGRILACAVGAVLAVGVSAAGDPAAKGFLPAWFKSAKGQFPGDKENYYTYSPAGMLMNFFEASAYCTVLGMGARLWNGFVNRSVFKDTPEILLKVAISPHSHNFFLSKNIIFVK